MAFRKIFLFLCFSFSPLFADVCVVDNFCNSNIPITRSDNIPQTHVAHMTDEYFTGYIQSLIDMHYYDFKVRVLTYNGCVYVFNLPNNAVLASSILCFIYDIPCVNSVVQIRCCPGDFISFVNQTDPACAEKLACSPAYMSMLCAPPPRCQLQGIWFPQNTLLFYPLIADPRQVMNAASIRFKDDVISEKVGAVSFGDDFIFIRLKDIFWCHGDMDLGIQAGIFAVFDLDNPETCLVNTDFFVAAMSTYAVDRWSFRLRLWHLSSHLGDEFLLQHPGFDRRNVSDEGIDFFASYQLGRALRLYAGLGYIIDRDRTFQEKPFYVEAGAEIRVFGGRLCFNRLYMQPFLAMHFRSWEEHAYDIDQTYALGVEWSKIQGVGRKLRIYFEYHNGFSKEGQFVKQRCDYYALKLNYGF